MDEAGIRAFYAQELLHRPIVYACGGWQKLCQMHGSMIHYDADSVATPDRISLPGHCCAFARGCCLSGARCPHAHLSHRLKGAGPLHCSDGRRCKFGHWCSLQKEARLPVPAAPPSGPAAEDDDSESSSSECGDAPAPGTIELRASQIRWAHNSIKARFRNGMLLVDTLKELLDGSLQPHQLPAFFVWQRGSAWFAITGNRRLWVLREFAEISAVEVVVRARQLNPWVHLSPWFRRMFSTDCDGMKVQFRGAQGRYPSMQMALQSGRSIPSSRELLVAQELQQSPHPVPLEVLERRFAGQFSAREVVLSKQSLFTVTSGHVALARPVNLPVPGLTAPKPASPTPMTSKVHGAPPIHPMPPPKAPPSLQSIPSEDPWASGHDPWSQSLKAGDLSTSAPPWKAPPLCKPSGEGAGDPWTGGKDPWSMASASSAAIRYRSPPAPRASDSSEPSAAQTPAPKPKRPPPPVPSSSEESEAEPAAAVKVASSSDSDGSDEPEEPEERRFRHHAAKDQPSYANIDRLLETFPSKGFAVAALRDHTAPTSTDMQVGWVLRNSGGCLSMDELTQRCKDLKKISHFYLRRRTHLFSSGQQGISFADPPALIEGQDLLPENWATRFPSEGFALASTSKAWAPTELDFQIGWALRHAGGQLKRQKLREQLAGPNRNVKNFLKPKYFQERPHLFVMNGRTPAGIISFAVPARIARPQASSATPAPAQVDISWEDVVSSGISARLARKQEGTDTQQASAEQVSVAGSTELAQKPQQPAEEPGDDGDGADSLHESRLPDCKWTRFPSLGFAAAAARGPEYMPTVFDMDLGWALHELSGAADPLQLKEKCPKLPETYTTKSYLQSKPHLFCFSGDKVRFQSQIQARIATVSGTSANDDNADSSDKSLEEQDATAAACDEADVIPEHEEQEKFLQEAEEAKQK
ncbi:unnamed protein product, partial [Symbiodinium sp. CCMP2456]